MQHAEKLTVLSYIINQKSVNGAHGYIYINCRAITTRPIINTLLFNSDYFCFFLSPITEIIPSLALKCYSSHMRDLVLFQSSATSVTKYKQLRNLQGNSLLVYKMQDDTTSSLRDLLKNLDRTPCRLQGALKEGIYIKTTCFL